MRRFTPLLLVPALLIALMPTAGQAATAKAGGKCTKVGATTKVGTATLKCSSAKKWALVKPVVAPKPIPTVTPTPTQTKPAKVGIRIQLTQGCHAKGMATLQKRLNGTWTDFMPADGWELGNGCAAPTEYQPWTVADVKVGDVIRWKVYAPTWEWFSNGYTYKDPIKPYTAVTSPDAPVTDFASVGIKSRDSILTIPVASSPNTVTYKNESTIPEAVVAFAKSAGDYAMKYLSSLLPKDMVFNIMIFTTREWGYSTSLTYDPNNAAFKSDMDRTFPQWGGRQTPTCEGGGGFSVGYLDNPLLAIEHGCKLTDRDMSLIAHEIAHSTQAKYAESENPGCVAPIWFVEGQAQAFGSALAYNEAPKWREARTFHVGQQEKPYPTIMKEMEPKTLRNQEYSSGLLMVEYLVARSGWKKSLDVLLEASRLADRGCLQPGEPVMKVFGEAFKTVYGQTIDQFYGEVYAYLEWSYANKGR